MTTSSGIQTFDISANLTACNISPHPGLNQQSGRTSALIPHLLGLYIQVGGKDGLKGSIKRTRQLPRVNGFDIFAAVVASIDPVGLFLLTEKITQALCVIVVAKWALDSFHLPLMTAESAYQITQALFV